MRGKSIIKVLLLLGVWSMETALRLIWLLGVTLHIGRVHGCCHCVSPWASLTTVTPLARCTLCHWSHSADTCLCHEDQWHHMCLSRYVTLPELLISTKCCCHNHCCCCCHNDQIATKESPAHWPAHCKHNQIQSCFVFDSLILSEILHQRLGAGNLRWCNDICAIQ